MKTETKVLGAMLTDRSASLSIRQLARNAGAGYRIVHTAVQRLCGSGALVKKPFGGSSAVALSGRLTPEVMAAELGRREVMLKNPGFDAIQEKLAGFRFPVIALVFGSHTRGVARKGSDIDLLVVCSGEHEAAVNGALSILPLKIHLVLLSYEDFISMARSREFTVVSEAMKSNVILAGIEDFYRMAGHA